MDPAKKTLLILMTLAAVALAGPASNAKADVVFEDNFNNNIVADSDGVPATGTGFWTTHLFDGADGTNAFAETGGKVTLTALEADTSGTSISISSNVSSDFNFFTSQRTYSVSGMSLGGTLTQPGKKIGRFLILSSGDRFTTSSDGVLLEITGSGVIFFRVRLNGSNTTLVNGVDADSGGVITGFDLVLDATNYDLKIHSTTGTFDSSDNAAFAGTHGLTLPGWDNGGNSLLGLESGRGDGANAGQSSIFNVDKLTVTAIPEPATLGMLALGGMMMTFRGRR